MRKGRAFQTAVLAACVALLSTGCSGSPQLAQAGTPTADPLTAPATPPAFPHATPGTLPLLQKPPSHGATSLPWSLQTIAADRRDLTIVFPASCVTIAGAQVAETSADVTVTVWGVTGSGACAASLRLQFATISLSRQLGSRTLLHAPPSKQWASGHYFE